MRSSGCASSFANYLAASSSRAGRRAEGPRSCDVAQAEAAKLRKRRIAAGGGTVVSPQRPRLITRQADPCRSAVIAATASS